MATLSMMPSPHLTSAPHSRPHTPLALSPGGSPQLRPKGSTSTLKPSPTISSSLPASASAPGPISAADSSTSPRSYARAPERRPYAPLLSSRAMPGAKVELEGDTKMFVELVAQMVVARTNTRGRRLSNNGDKGAVARSVSSSRARAASPGAGASLPGSWEGERAELLVDVPVWSPGCFQDLSTLHSLRDRTLAQVHALLAHLISSHSIPASYHLLARSALATPSSPSVSHRSPLNSSAALPITPKYATPAQNAQRARHPGWGCIRLAPSVVSPMMGKLELRPKVRRSSMDFSTSPNKRIPRVQGHARAVTSPSSPTDAKGVLSASVSRAELTPAPALGLETIVARKPLGAGACEPPAGAAVEKEGANESGKVEDLGEKGETVLLETDDAVFVLDNQPEGGDEDEEVLYKSGYTSGTVSDDEDEDADEVVMREIEKRAAKEGSIFLMTLFGSPALILV